MARTVTWIHLSDMHLCPARTGWDSARILDKLTHDLSAVCDRYSLCPDLLFFTGDLAYGHLGDQPGERIEDQFSAAARFLDQLAASLPVPLPPKERMFIVPGNHDVHRGLVRPTSMAWLQDVSPNCVDDLIRDAGERWSEFMARLGPYINFLAAQGYKHLVGDPARAVYHARLEVNDVSVCVSGYNTAWSCGQDGEKGKLWMGGRWQAANGHGIRAGADLAIGLLHHPGNWLVEHEDPHVWRHELLPAHDFLLHGHEHDAWVVSDSNGHHTIAAGACYDRENHRNGYNLVRVDLDQSTATVWFRSYDRRGGGGWTHDFVQRKTDPEGRWNLSLGGHDTDPVSPSSGLPVVAATPTNRQFDLHGLSPETAATAVESEIRAYSGKTAAVDVTVGIVLHRIDDIGAASPLADELAAAIKLLDELKPPLALQAFDQLELKRDEELKPRDRYVILANRGNAARQMGDLVKAAALFRQAADHPGANERDRRLALALALDSEGNSDQAHECLSLVRDEPDPARPQQVSGLWVSTAPPHLSVREILDLLTEVERQDAKVLYALARRAITEEEYDHAEAFAREAFRDDPDSFEVRSLLAATLVLRSFGSQVRVGYSLPAQPDWPGYEEARDLLLTGLDQAGDVSPAYVAEHRSRLGMLYMVVGDVERALEQFRLTSELMPDAADAMESYLLALEKTGAVAQAVEIARAWLAAHSSRGIEYRLVGLLLSRCEPSDLTEAKSILAAGREAVIGESDAELAVEWLALLVQVLLEQGDAATAREVFAEIPSGALPAHAHLGLGAEITAAEGDRVAAVREARRAQGALPANAPGVVVGRLAALFEALEEYGHAWRLFKQLATPPEASHSAARFVECARRAGEYEEIASFGRSLREAGIVEHWFVTAELHALQMLSSRRLIATLGEVLPAVDDGPFRRELQAWLSYHAILCDRRDLATFDPSRLPSVDAVPDAGIGAIVVAVLGQSEKPFTAVEYAYALYQRFPDSYEAHAAVIESTGFPFARVEFPQPEVIGPGVAVQLRTQPDGDDQWWIIEDGPSPSVARGEWDPATPAAQILVGKAVGDQVALPPFGRRTEIVGILSKYQRRWLDCLENLDRRFPGQSRIERRQLPSLPNGEPDVQPVLDFLKNWHDRNARVLEHYRDHELPMAFGAHALDRTVVEFMEQLADSRIAPVRCCNGLPGELHMAAAAMSQADALVVDPTALGTLYLLGRGNRLNPLPVLADCPTQLVVSEYALDELRHLLDELDRRAGHSVEAPATQEQQRRGTEAIRRLVSWVAERCQVVSGSTPATAKDEDGQHLLAGFGRAGIESIRLCRVNRWPLWTDDASVAKYAWSIGHVPRIWSQVHLSGLLAVVGRPKEDQAQLALQLLELRYSHTWLDPVAFTMAGREVSWEPGMSPLSQVLNHFADSTVDTLRATGLGLVCLVELWRTVADDSRACRVTGILLERLASKPSGRSVVEGLAENVDQAFGADKVNAQRCQACVRWHLNRRRMAGPW